MFVTLSKVSLEERRGVENLIREHLSHEEGDVEYKKPLMWPTDVVRRSWSYLNPSTIPTSQQVVSYSMEV